MERIKTPYNKNLISIADSMQIWMFTACNNGGAARQERILQSETNHNANVIHKLKTRTRTY